MRACRALQSSAVHGKVIGALSRSVRARARSLMRGRVRTRAVHARTRSRHAWWGRGTDPEWSFESLRAAQAYSSHPTRRCQRASAQTICFLLRVFVASAVGSWLTLTTRHPRTLTPHLVASSGVVGVGFFAEGLNILQLALPPLALSETALGKGHRKLVSRDGIPVSGRGTLP